MKEDLIRVATELDRFREELLGSQDDSIDLLLDRYTAFRRTLAKQFRKVAEARLLRKEPVIDGLRLRIEAAIRAAGALGALPDKYLTVRPYGGTHTVLLEYLAGRLGQPVPASRLRVLTGDQIHTERRVRELRDLGLDVSWTKVSDEDQYLLESLSIEMVRAAKCQLERSIRADKSTDKAQKRSFLGAVPEFVEQMHE